jgi:RNA polymerase sigma-70 factor (ECF subfamily)
LLDEAAERELSASYEGQERDDILRRLILDLPMQQQNLLTLAFYEGLSHAQIAERTGTPLGTVKSRLRLAFSRLRHALEDAGVVETG